MLDAMCCIGAGLIGRHGKVEEKLVIVPGQEVHNLGKRRTAFYHLAQRFRYGLYKQIGSGIIAHMQLIPHGQRLRNDHL